MSKLRLVLAGLGGILIANAMWIWQEGRKDNGSFTFFIGAVAIIVVLIYEGDK